MTPSLAVRPAVPLSFRRPIAIGAVVSAGIVVVLGVLYRLGGTLGGFDGIAVPWDRLHGAWRVFALVVDFFGEPAGSAILTVAFVAACIWLRRRRLAVLAVLSLGVTIGLTTLLKYVVGRTIHGGYLSFPSGHTAFATAFALLVALLIADLIDLGSSAGFLLFSAMALLGIGVLAAGAVMGWAEVALSAHYPTDTLGGLCTALAAVPAVTWLVNLVGGR